MATLYFKKNNHDCLIKDLENVLGKGLNLKTMNYMSMLKHKLDNCSNKHKRKKIEKLLNFTKEDYLESFNDRAVYFKQIDDEIKGLELEVDNINERFGQVSLEKHDYERDLNSLNSQLKVYDKLKAKYETVKNELMDRLGIDL
jgi:hypothetical protein